MTNTSMEESHEWMTKEKREMNCRSSTVPNTRRRIATKTSLEENKSDERTVAVTTQESLDGIREKAMRIAGLDELETGKQQCRKMVQSGGAARRTGTRKANEIVRATCGSDNGERRRHCRRLRQQVKAVERQEFEASNTKLEHEICRRCEESRVSFESVHQQ